ncbi:hypothetical protein FF011L_48140 [Roseimaritima multifibrata]|uniref:DUF202 domain-containing protein n=1 Tax=Roseimaritima multifibrata TaxID=1930274 RepID=A0A517MMD7_9BACT|nr:DUF202 domain-containing protein [Roseimaritima multifibrata]QDS96010.1 hypothetical protein FF011L_48140 [Roseimaritima multifibrata]
MGNSSPGLDESAEQTPADSAIDRTLMAEERTFSAWLRTGLASLATGLAIAKLMPEAQPRWALVGLGIILVVMGAMSFLVGLGGYIRGAKHWQKSTRYPLSRWVVACLSILSAAAVLLAVVLILNR